MDEIQTIVVHIEQLTPDNMKSLSENGYSIIRDSQLLIFGRKMPKADPITPNGNHAEIEGLPEEVVPLTKDRVHRSRSSGDQS